MEFEYCFHFCFVVIDQEEEAQVRHHVDEIAGFRHFLLVFLRHHFLFENVDPVEQVLRVFVEVDWLDRQEFVLQLPEADVLLAARNQRIGVGLIQVPQLCDGEVADLLREEC